MHSDCTWLSLIFETAGSESYMVSGSARQVEGQEHAAFPAASEKTNKRKRDLAGDTMKARSFTREKNSGFKVAPQFRW